MERFLDQLRSLNVEKKQECLALNSYYAFMAAKCNSNEQEQIVRRVNEVVLTTWLQWKVF